MAQFAEEEKMLRRIDKRFSKGVVEYGLIEDGDKILIGLSGGKDSLALVELLARRARIYKPRFSIVAVHVVMKNIPYQSDVDYLREYVESWGVPLSFIIRVKPLFFGCYYSFSCINLGRRCARDGKKTTKNK